MELINDLTGEQIDKMLSAIKKNFLQVSDPDGTITEDHSSEFPLYKKMIKYVHENFNELCQKYDLPDRLNNGELLVQILHSAHINKKLMRNSA